MQESGRINRDRFLSWQPGGGAGCTVTRQYRRVASALQTGRDCLRTSSILLCDSQLTFISVREKEKKKKRTDECVSSPFRSPWKYNNAWKVIFSPHSVSVRGETAAVFVFVLVAPVKLRFLLLLFSISLLPLFKTELSFRLAASWGGAYVKGPPAPGFKLQKFPLDFKPVWSLLLTALFHGLLLWSREFLSYKDVLIWTSFIINRGV